MICGARWTRHNTELTCQIEVAYPGTHRGLHDDKAGTTWTNDGGPVSATLHLEGDAIKEPLPLPPNEGQHPECPICHQRLGMHAHSEAQIDAANEKEAVNHPSHYGGDVPHEHIKCITAWGLDNDYRLGQATKYLARAGKKDPAKEIEDLEKAVWYIQSKIELLKKKS